MKTRTKWFFGLLLGLATFFVVSCDKDDEEDIAVSEIAYDSYSKDSSDDYYSGGGSSTTGGNGSSGGGSSTTGGNGGSYGGGSGSTITKTCHICNGLGRCSSASGYDSQHCMGSGKCKTCSGQGWYYFVGEKISCPNCDTPGTKTRYGNGKCSFCHGTGKCWKCNGTGEVEY